MCEIHGCKGVILARGMCRKHYLRWWKHGDPSIVKIPEQKTGEESPNFKHGKWDHPLYKTWLNMMDRCYNTGCASYKNYGGRGISVCSDWHDIGMFIKDMGDRPDGHSLDRIDNEKGYSKVNCRWATSADQARNRRNVVLSIDKAREIRSLPRKAKNGRGQGYTRAEIAKKYGVSVATIKKVLSGDYWKDEKIMKAYKQ